MCDIDNMRYAHISNRFAHSQDSVYFSSVVLFISSRDFHDYHDLILHGSPRSTKSSIIDIHYEAIVLVQNISNINNIA